MSRIGVFLLAIWLAVPAFAQETEAHGVAPHPSTTQDQPEPVPVLNSGYVCAVADSPVPLPF
jgi:hypothetical protein